MRHRYKSQNTQILTRPVYHVYHFQNDERTKETERSRKKIGSNINYEQNSKTHTHTRTFEKYRKERKLADQILVRVSKSKSKRYMEMKCGAVNNIKVEADIWRNILMAFNRYVPS